MLFKDIIDKQMTDPPVRDTRVSTTFHPSAASTKFRCSVTGRLEVIGSCLRREWFRLRGEPPTETADGAGVRKMQAGNYLQPVVEEALKMAGLWRGSEVSFEIRKRNLSGRIDCWLVDPTRTMDGKEVLMPCEIKTVGKWKEEGTVRPNRLNQFKPSDDHLLQCIPYLDYYSQFIPDLKGVILYLGRDSMEIGEHHIWLVGKGEYGMKWRDDERYLMVRNQLGTMEMPHLNVRGVYKRYMQLYHYCQNDEMPPEDYNLQWSNEQILAYAKAGPEYGKLNATEIKKFNKMVKDDPDIGERDGHILKKGDWQCSYCPWQTRCKTGLRHVAKDVIQNEQVSHLSPEQREIIDDGESPL